MSQGILDSTTARRPDDIHIELPAQNAGAPKYEYPGIPTTCDGAEAVVHVEIHIAQGTGAYPITSSTTKEENSAAPR